ncbi:MAG: hypothetical protein GY756_00790 [bacterium]|nr:hypothetical protein [bacterium]
MKKLITIIILLLITIVIVTISSVVMYNFAIKNLKTHIAKNEEILAMTKASEITYQITDYHQRLQLFSLHVNHNYNNSDLVRKILHKEFDIVHDLFSIYIISNSKILFSYPETITQADGERAIKIYNFFLKMKIQTGKLNVIPDNLMSDSIPFMKTWPAEDVLVAKTDIENIFDTQEVLILLFCNLNKILQIKNHNFANIKGLSVWLFDRNNEILGSSIAFNNRGEALLAYEKLKKKSENLVQVDHRFKILSTYYRIEILRETKEADNVVFPLSIKYLYVGSHIFLISIFIITIIFMLYGEFRIKKLNKRISSLNLQINKAKEIEMLKEVTSSDFFNKISELAEDIKKEH